MLGVSTVVWDCGLLMVDYLVSRNRRDIEVSSCPSSTSSISKSSLGTCLDLGCGTGVVGLASLLLGADKCVFSDKSITPWYSHFCSLNYFSLLFNFYLSTFSLACILIFCNCRRIYMTELKLSNMIGWMNAYHPS